MSDRPKAVAQKVRDFVYSEVKDMDKEDYKETLELLMDEFESQHDCVEEELEAESEELDEDDDDDYDEDEE